MRDAFNVAAEYVGFDFMEEKVDATMGQGKNLFNSSYGGVPDTPDVLYDASFAKIFRRVLNYTSAAAAAQSREKYGCIVVTMR